jgi:peptidoglycan/LPS O-acetylase OafA/YrhL
MKHRYVYLDGLRGIAAIMVVIFHFTQHTDNPLMRNAYFSVDLFFVLSGFVITKAYRQRIATGMAFSEFAALRIKRLYPMFAVGLGLGVVAVLLKIAVGQSDFSKAEVFGSAITNAFYFPFFSSKMLEIGRTEIRGTAFPANNPAWTLFFEFYVNLLFFWLWRSALYSTKRLGGIWIVSLAIFVAAIGLGWGSSGWGASVRHLVIGFDRTIYGFAAGVLIASLPSFGVPARRQRIIGALVFLGFIAICAMPGGKITFLIAVIAAPLLVLAGSLVAMGDRANAVGNWLGELSYPLYCIHFPILMIADATGLIRGGFVSTILWVTATVILASSLGRFVDEPIRRVLRREPWAAKA